MQDFYFLALYIPCEADSYLRIEHRYIRICPVFLGFAP